jgi:hypothetical protein
MTRLLYYVLVWPVATLGRGIVDDVLVLLKVKRALPTGRPVWRR